MATKQEIKERITRINFCYDLELSVEYYNGLAWLKTEGITITAGTKNEIWEAITCFMVGYSKS